MFSKLLVPIDMSSPEAGLRSCPRARELQDAFGAKVHLMSVLAGYNMPMVASFFPKSAVDTMLGLGVESSKIFIGVAFYSRGFGNTDGQFFCYENWNGKVAAK